jgi:hypothetical protein
MQALIELAKLTERMYPEVADVMKIVQEECENYAEHLDGIDLDQAIKLICNESFLMNELFYKEFRKGIEELLLEQINVDGTIDNHMHPLTH